MAQAIPTNETPQPRQRRRRRQRRWFSRIQPVTWKKFGAYILAYAIASVIVWKL
ncbi:MAG: hypothetical protein ACXW2L_09170 [Burkholderiales bacterium]